MSKKLKIQFWKAEKALAMQILEQEGLPEEKNDGDIRIWCEPKLCGICIYLRGVEKVDDLEITHITFYTNTERDAYLKKIVNAITDELFTGEGELKVGEMCEVKDDEDEPWKKRKLLAILPKKYKCRYIAEAVYRDTAYEGWDCASPIAKSIEPTVEECGQLITYTWEMEVAE